MPASGGAALPEPPQNLVDRPCIVHHCMHYDCFHGLYFSVEKKKYTSNQTLKNKGKTKMEGFY